MKSGHGIGEIECTVFADRPGNAVEGGCRPDSGMTMMELIVCITILGIMAMTSTPLVVDLLSSLWTAQGKAEVNQVARESLAALSDELREAVASPATMRPWVSQDGSALRFYRSSDPADSIRYLFASNGGGDQFMFRSAGASGMTMIPPFADREVDFVSGSFSVDGSMSGFSSTGRVGINIHVGRRLGIDPDSTVLEMDIYCRNFR